MSDTGMVKSIGGIIADVTVEEHHTDTLQISDHPVERGAQISDHAFKLPVELTIVAGWSNSSPNAGGDPGYIDDVYQQLLDLQDSRELIEIQTTRRLYENMLVRSVALTTNAETNDAILVSASCREVILVDTVATTLPPTANMADPAKTAPVTDVGTKQTVPAPQANQSALSALLGG